MKISFVKVELTQQNELLERIAVALERMAGPIEIPAEPSAKENRYFATDKDLRVVSQADIERRERAIREICAANMVQPFTPAGEELIRKIEQEVMDEGGQEAFEQLPWIK